MRHRLAMLLLAGAAHAAAFSAESAVSDSVKGKTLEQWVAQLGSDQFDERDAASKALASAGERAIPVLKKALESADGEVRFRAQVALTALETVSIAGEFVRIESESYSQSGQRTIQSNEAGESTLAVRMGKVVFRQEYSKGIEQTYSFPENTSLTFRSKCSIALAWESINDDSSYNPDSGDPKLECANTDQGLRITLSATDTSGTTFRMIYAPKAEVERERAKAETKEKRNP